ncbi:MAG: CD3324 family protein [Lachnospiraceae bacterium]|nr:CD3324 family protein [Lachnospiraceae bacterium]
MAYKCYLHVEKAYVIHTKNLIKDMLVEELQKYVQAGCIYIPAKDEQHKSWGESSGYRKKLYERNEIIIKKYQNGVSIEELAEEYYLSVYAIRKIIYQK